MTNEERMAWVEHCVLAELRGNLMQSLAGLTGHFVKRFVGGQVQFGVSIRVASQTTAMAVLDAQGALGPYAGKYAMEFACQRAQKVGAFTVVVRNANDWSMISYCTRQALRFDCVGIAMLRHSKPEVAPWGGTEAVYGMNPISVAIPASRHYPILVDMAAQDTGGLAAMEGIVRDHRTPAGLYFDRSGQLIREPRPWSGEFGDHGGHDAGAQRMSGYRDMALTVITDCLGGALSGTGSALDPAVDGTQGAIVLALHVEHFVPLNEFTEMVDRAIDYAKTSSLEDGFTEILMPGERGYREEQLRRQEGIPIIPKVWKRLVDLCSSRGIDVDLALSRAESTRP